jgi:hypothetical protein
MHEDSVSDFYRRRAQALLRTDGLSIRDRNFLHGLETGKLYPIPISVLAKLQRLEKAANPKSTSDIYVAPVFADEIHGHGFIAR